MKKKLIIYSSILLLVLFSIVGVLSYAYFSASVNTNNAAIVNTTLPNGSYTFTTTNASSINISVSANKMLSSAVSYYAIASGNTNFEVKLTSPDENSKVVCTYDLVWEWTSADKYTISDATLTPYIDHEMSVSANGTTTGSSTIISDIVDNTLHEIDLSNFTWSNSKATILKDAVIVSNSKTTPTVTKWNITQKIYNLSVAQPNLQGKNFKSKVYASNVNCQFISSNTTPIILSGDLNTIGSQVCFGDQCFYVIGNDESDSTKVKLFAKYNLLVGNILDNTSWEMIEISNSTDHYGIQSSIARGSVDGRDDDIGVIEFALEDEDRYTSNGYWADDDDNLLSSYGEDYPSWVYDNNTSIKVYVDNYRKELNKTYGLSLGESSARIIKKEELEAIGCNTSENSCFSAPRWIKNTSFWTGTAKDEYSISTVTSFWEWGMYDFGDGAYYYNDYYGIRPVIIVPKSIFK